jgi:hypothetical protein
MGTIHEQAADEYEFYIPAVVWEHAATRKFLAWLTSDIEGATVFNGAVGAWEGQVERTHVVRVLVRQGDTGERFRSEARRLMREWGRSDSTRQESVMYSRREVMVTIVEGSEEND